MTGYLAMCAYASALLAGAFASATLWEWHRLSARQRKLHSVAAGGAARARGAQGGLAGVLLAALSRYDAAARDTGKGAGSVRLGKAAGGFGLGAAGAGKTAEKLVLAGLDDVLPENAMRCRARIAAFCAGAGLLVGLPLTPLAALLLAFAGAAAGWASVPWALGEAAKERTRLLEQHLSESMEVICLGLRAGLSFDRSLELYWTNFPSQLALEFAHAQQAWQTGLLGREQALRSLAARYDSSILPRVADSIIRSLRFGSPLADTLEELAGEARRAHRSKVEEAVMKAPVKMMLPVGLLILPSMLLLVMGPVMLELIVGF